MNINKETSVVIGIPADNQYYLGRDRVQLNDIPDKVKAMLKDKPAQDQVVYIKSSDNVKYGTVVQVVDMIRDAGFERIGLVSKKEKEQGGGGGDTGSQPSK